MKTMKTTMVCTIILFTLLLFTYIPHIAAEDTSTWNLPEGAKVRLGKGSISGLAVSPDGTRFAAASSVGIWIHDIETGEELSLFTGYGLFGTGLEIDSVVFSPDGKTIASGNSDGSVMIWDAETGHVQRTYQKHAVGEGVTHVAFGPDGKVLASASTTGNLHIYDVTTGVLLRSESPLSRGQKISFTSIAFSHDGKRLAGSSSDGAIFLWNLDDPAQIPAPVVTGPYLFGIRSVLTVTFSHDGKTLANGSVAGIHFWDAKTGTHLHTFTEHWAKNTSSLTFSSDGKTLVSVNTQFISVSDVETRTNRDIRLNSLYSKTIGFHDNLVLTPDGSILVNNKDKINLYDFKELTLRYSVTGYEADRRKYDVAFRPTDGKIVASSSSKGIYLWDAETWAFLRLLSTGTGSGRDAYRGAYVAFSPDGKTLAACRGSRIDLWNVENVETATLRRTLTGPPSNYNLSVVFSPDGKTLASGASSYTYGTGNSYTIQLWNVEEGTIRHTLTGVSHVFDVAFSPDGKTLATGGVRNTILLWDVENVENVETVPIRHTLTETGGQVQSIAFSTDGKTLASASGSVFLWDVKTGRKLRRLYKGQETSFPYQYGGYITAFGPDGRTFLVGGKRGINLWNMEENALGRKVPVDIRNTLPTSAFQVAFSPDKQTLASTSNDGVVMLWNTPSEPIVEKEVFRNTHMLHGHTERVRDIAFSPNGKILASGGDDKIIRLWDIGRNTVLRSLKGHWHRILGLTFSQDGNTLVSWDYDTIRVWDVFPGTLRYMLPADLYAYRHNHFYRSVAISPNGRTLACVSGESGKSVFLWDVLTGTHRHTLEHTREVRYLKFGPDGHTLQTISWNDVNEESTHLFWDVVIGTLTSSQDNFFDDPDRQIRINQSFYWSLGGNIHYMEFIDKETNAVVRRIPMEDSVRIIGFRSDNRILLTAKTDANNQLASWYGASGTLVIYDVETGTPLQTVEEVKNHTVFLSPSGETIATTYENTVWLWDLDLEPGDDITDTHGDVIVNITDDSGTTHQPEVKTEADYRVIDLNTKVDVMRYWTYSTLLSPDGKTLASFVENTINLWDTETAILRDTINVEQEYEFRDNFRGAVFDPDSKTLATAVDKTVLLWDMETLAIRQKFTGHINIFSMAYSPDGTTLAIGGPDEIILWDIARNTHIIGQGSFIPRYITFNPDGKTLAIVSGGSVFFFDVKRGVLNGELNIASYPRRANNPRGSDQSLVRASRVVFSPDGKTLIVQHDHSPNVSFWHVETGISLHFIEQYYLHLNDISTTQLVGRGRNRPAYTITSFAVSPDGKTLALGQSRRGIQVWDVNSGTLRYTITSVSQAATRSSDARVGATQLAFTPDGELVSVDVDHIVRIWDIAPKLGSSLIIPDEPEKRRTVHAIYYYPSDKDVDQDRLRKMDDLTKEAQEWFANEMQENGYHSKTYSYLKRNIRSQYTEEQLIASARSDLEPKNDIGQFIKKVWLDIIDEWEKKYGYNIDDPNKTKDIYIAFVDMDFAYTFFTSEESYTCGAETVLSPTQQIGNPKVLMSLGEGDCLKTRTLAHELGHAFGLAHNVSSNPGFGKEYIMSYGTSIGSGRSMGYRLAESEAHWLSAHPAFIPYSSPIVDNNTTINIISNKYNPLQVEVKDSDGIHQVQLHYIDCESGGFLKALGGINYKGKSSFFDHKIPAPNTTKETFEFDISNLCKYEDLPILISVMDEYGDITQHIAEIDRHVWADVNNDGIVDGDDLLFISENFGQTGYNKAGLNGDGVVDIKDLVYAASEIPNADAAPEAWHYYLGDTLTLKQVGQWITQARQLNLTESFYQRGIQVLEQLLTALADVNDDGLVDNNDLLFIDANFGQTGKNDADVDGNGVVNIRDLALVAGAIKILKIPDEAAAPEAWRHYLGNTLTREQVEQWITQARQLNLTDPVFQHGIWVLEQLLAALTPQETALLPNYPNPFNPETWIPYQLAKPADVSISIYATDGKLVRKLDLGHQPVGTYQHRNRAVHWDGKNAVGESVASGVYFYTLSAGEYTATRRMLILK